MALCGPISPATHSGKKLIFLLVDDCTRFMWAYFLTSKDQAFSTFKEFRQKIEMEMRMKVRMLRTDRGGEFTSNEFTKYCKENGIARQLTAPYSPQQNGVVERRNRTVLSTTRSMMKAMKLPYFLGEAEQDPINDPNSPITPSTYTYIPHSEEEEEATTSSTKNLGNRFDHVPVRGFKDLAEIYQNTQEVETETLLFTEKEPRNYKEASTDKKWIEAMEIELDSINKNNTWTLTTLPPDQKAIGLKWVFKTKRDAKGNIIQLQASFARIETVRLILALAAHHGWQVHHLDVKSAFLHGDLKEEVYVTQPEGFVQQGNSGKVYKPTKALYGLRQAQKQPTVALSSCESEFMAATGAACQALWLKRLLSELTGWEEKRITLKVDNVSAIALVRNPVFHGRSKHIDIRYHFIRECVENGHINVEHVSGELQRADILTKALPRLKRGDKSARNVVVEKKAYTWNKEGKEYSRKRFGVEIVSGRHKNNNNESRNKEGFVSVEQNQKNSFWFGVVTKAWYQEFVCRKVLRISKETEIKNNTQGEKQRVVPVRATILQWHQSQRFKTWEKPIKSQRLQDYKKFDSTLIRKIKDIRNCWVQQQMETKLQLIRMSTGDQEGNVDGGRNSSGTAWIKEPQAFAKMSVEIEDTLDGTPRKKSRIARDDVNKESNEKQKQLEDMQSSSIRLPYLKYKDSHAAQTKKKKNEKSLFHAITPERESTTLPVKFTTEATIVEISAAKGWYYRKCNACNKKVPEGSSDPQCKDNGPQPTPNYGAIINDDTGMATVTCFSTEAQTFLPDCNEVGARPEDPEFTLDVAFKPSPQPLLSLPPPHSITPPHSATNILRHNTGIKKK
ncbi:zinc finger, CCHC-type containing protein [Tanacetum coccineum]